MPFFIRDYCSYQQQGEVARGISTKTALKVLVIGHRRVGKTSIKNQLRRMFNNRHNRKRDGANLAADSFRFIESTLLDMPNMRRLTIGTAETFILIYAAGNVESIDYIKVLMEDIKEIKGKDVPLIVVSNKSDIEVIVQNRFEAGYTLTAGSKYEHVEVSARTGNNLNKVFSFLLESYGQFNNFPESKSSDVNRDRTLKKKLGAFFRRIFSTQ